MPSRHGFFFFILQNCVEKHFKNKQVSAYFVRLGRSRPAMDWHLPKVKMEKYFYCMFFVKFYLQ